MAHLLTKPQQKLQQNYKTNITQNHQKIEPYEYKTADKLKKSRSSRQVAGVETWRCMERCREVETWNGWSHTHMWWIKIGRDSLGVRDSSPTSDHTAQGSSARKLHPHNFWQ